MRDGTMDGKGTASGYSWDHADVFELVHAAKGRDWDAEADQVAELIRSRLPDATSLLDVACGSGAHLARFSEYFTRLEGVEISEAMRKIAAVRVPDIPVHAGDLRDFDLGSTFDALTCMCFSIAYTRSVAELNRAVATMARHVKPGGVLVVEPWWFPDTFIDGFVGGSVVNEGGRVVSRVSHSVRKDGATHMTVRFTVADSAGIRDFTELEVCSLYSHEQYLEAFRRADVRAERVETSLSPNGNGLFVGVREA
ncbi:class I SAM-dependent DNA methyltransferase [Streptomyces coeruleorubidus]|uniref:class I SAM-dependent DNA methyltransferase n=1 Tax=Streptomyces coeruleorubidus TaxID=116188 RepID=UPI00378BE635